MLRPVLVCSLLLGATFARAQTVAITAEENACPSRHEVETELQRLRPGAVLTDRDAKVRATIVDLGERYRVTLTDDKVLKDPLRRCDERARTTALVIALALDEIAPEPVVAPPIVPPPAMASGENTKAACSDGVDNDGDGHVDCEDQDCQDFVMCVAPGTAAEAAAKERALRNRRGRAVTKTVAGALMMTLGTGLALGSTGTWLSYDDSTDSCNSCRAQGAFLGVSLTLDIVGAGLITTGAVFTAQGSGERAATAPFFTPGAWRPDGTSRWP